MANKSSHTKDKFIFIAGPCVIENERLTLQIASFLKELTQKYSFRFIFKASFDKANRTSFKSFRGPGFYKGLKILAKVKEKLGIEVLSDIHTPQQAKVAGEILDVIQIPAFLCRQTDLLIAAAGTKRIVNVKKGQFLSPQEMRFVVEKIEAAGGKNIFLTERGTFFGYNNLVVDFRSFAIMKKIGYPVIFDVTHSLQRPGKKAGYSGGDKEFAIPLARAAVAFGVDGLFCEVHPKPQKALSDKETSLDFKEAAKVAEEAFKIKNAR